MKNQKTYLKSLPLTQKVNKRRTRPKKSVSIHRMTRCIFTECEKKGRPNSVKFVRLFDGKMRVVGFRRSERRRRGYPTVQIGVLRRELVMRKFQKKNPGFGVFHSGKKIPHPPSPPSPSVVM